MRLNVRDVLYVVCEYVQSVICTSSIKTLSIDAIPLPNQKTEEVFTVLRVTPTGQRQKVYSMEMHGETYPEQMRVIASLFGGPNPRFNVQGIFADYTGCGVA